MKAAVIEAPGRLVVREIPEPEMGDYQSRCRLLFGAICTGTDSHLVKGTFCFPSPLPAVLGHESVGRVAEIGSKVRHLKVGDLVTRIGVLPTPKMNVMWGGFAEWGVAHDHRAMQENGLPEPEWKRFRVEQVVPPDIAPAEATMMITWRETLSYTTRLGVLPGAKVLIIGSGGNGLAFAAHARNLGAGLVAMVGANNREETALAVGASHFVSYRDEEIGAQLKKIAPDGFDFIIDAVGKKGQLDALLPQLADSGAVGIYGLDDWQELVLHPLQARGSFRFYNGGYDEAETHEQIVAAMREGKLQARHWLNLDAPFDLENIGAAFEALEKRELVKALVRLGSE